MKKILFTLALLISFKSFGQIEDLSSYTHRGNAENAWSSTAMNEATLSKSDLKKFLAIIEMYHQNREDGNYYEAIKYATKALNIKPQYTGKGTNQKYARILMIKRRAQLLTAVGNYSAALADYSQMISWGVTSFEIYMLRGNLLSLMGKNELACSDWNKAEKAYKELEESYTISGVVSRTTITTEEKETTKEVITYEKLVDIINNNCADDMHIIKNDYKADKYLQSGVDKANRLKDYYGAIADYTKAIELVPNDALAYYNRGLSKDILGDISGAMADYNKAIELDPNDADFYSNRGGIKLDLEDYYGAISDYSKVIELNPNDADAYYNRGISKFDLGDYYGAINDYSKAIELDTDNADAYYNRGLSKKLLGDLNGACKDAKIAVSLGYIVEWMSECN